MNLNHLMYFRVLARTEHYGRAALELYISQPSLSYAISALERELDTKLFEKKGRNIALTKYGLFFAEKVEKIFADLQDAEDKLRKMTGSRGGHIDLSYYHTLGVHIVPGIIRAYLKRPERARATFSLRQQTSQETVEGLLRGKHDLGFCTHIDQGKYPEISTLPVKKDYFYLVVHTEHPLAKHKKLSLEVLNDHPFVAFSGSSGLRPVIEEILREWDVTPSVAFEADQGSAVAGIVAAGLGVTLLPDIPLPVMDIVRIPLEEEVAPRITYLAYSKNHYQTEIVKDFYDFVKNYCSADDQRGNPPCARHGRPSRCGV